MKKKKTTVLPIKIFLKQLKSYLPYDLAIPLPRMYPKGAKSEYEKVTYNSICSTTILGSKDMDSAQMPFKTGMD